MPISSLEERVSAAVVQSLRDNFVLSSDKASWLPSFIAESILAELITSGDNASDTQSEAQEQPSPLLLSDLPDSQEQAEQLWGPLLLENLDDVQQEDVASFASQLLNSLNLIAQQEEERLGLGAGDDDEGEDGACEMCHRIMPLTKHHLIPRDVHKLWKQRGASYEELQAGIMVCRPCHNAVHRVADNKLLAQNFNTLDTLLAVPSIQKHIAWASKQKVTVRPANQPSKTRHKH